MKIAIPSGKVLTILAHRSTCIFSFFNLFSLIFYTHRKRPSLSFQMVLQMESMVKMQKKPMIRKSKSRTLRALFQMWHKKRKQLIGYWTKPGEYPRVKQIDILGLWHMALCFMSAQHNLSLWRSRLKKCYSLQILATWISFSQKGKYCCYRWLQVFDVIQLMFCTQHCN